MMTSLLVLLTLGTAEATPAGVLLTAAEIAFLDSVLPAGSVLAASDAALIAEQLSASWLQQQAIIEGAAGVAAEGAGTTAAAGRYIAGVARMHQQVVLKAAQAIGQLESVSAAILAHTGSTFLGLLIIDAGQYDARLGMVPENQHTAIFWDGSGSGISWLSFTSEEYYGLHGTGGGGFGSGGNESGGGPEPGSGGEYEPTGRSYEINTDPDPGSDGGGDDDDGGSSGYFSDSGGGSEGWAGCIIRPNMGRNGLTTQFSDSMHDAVADQLNGLSVLAVALDRVYLMTATQVPFEGMNALSSAAYTASFIVTPHGDRLELACGQTMMVDASSGHLEQVAAGDLSSFEGAAPDHVIDDAIEAIELEQAVHFDAAIKPQDLDAANR